MAPMRLCLENGNKQEKHPQKIDCVHIQLKRDLITQIFQVKIQKKMMDCLQSHSNQHDGRYQKNLIKITQFVRLPNFLKQLCIPAMDNHTIT